MKRPSETNNNDRSKKKCLKGIYEGELGIIESVTVQNFMCHENVTISFEPHMNFIIGLNGSGKSAILTAIILALGGKSSSTDRYANIKGFIKQGKQKAKVQVVLRNVGKLAYKPDVYGEKIIVEREFSIEGVSGYKIKSESGTVCSNQKSELTNILEAMDIMVECPVCIMTQTASKYFLISKDATDYRLFEFFNKATGLEVLEKRYQSLTIMRAEAEANLEKKRQALNGLKGELERWNKFLVHSEKIHQYKNEQIWAIAIKLGKHMQNTEEQYKKSAEEFEQHKKDLEACKKSLTEKSSELEKLCAQKVNLETKIKECNRKLKEYKIEFKKTSSSYRAEKGTLQKLENDKTELENDKLDLEKGILDRNRRDQSDLEEEKKKYEETLKKLNKKNSTLEYKLENSTDKLNSARNEKNNIEMKIKDLSAQCETYSNELVKIEDKLITTQNARKNSINAFGNSTDKVFMKIQSVQYNFWKLPMGPIGRYLDIKDSRWAAAVESAIGSSLLDSFCVDNYQDYQLLREILEKFYAEPPSIIVCPFESQIYDVQHGKVQSCFPSVLDMLTIKDNHIANCLVDQAQIERKILIENDREAVNLMNNPPKNCHSAYFINCDQISFNPSRIYFYGKETPNSRLSASKKDVIEKLEEDRDEKKAKIEELQKQIETMKKGLESLLEIIQNLEQEVVKTKTDMKQNLSEIEELKCKDGTKTVDYLQEELEALCRCCEQKKEDIKKWSKLISDLDTRRNYLQKEVDALTASLKLLNEDHETLLMKINDVSKLKASFQDGKQKYEAELKKKQNAYKKHKKEFEDLKKKSETAVSRAKSVCPRINTDKSVDELDILIKENERVLKEQSECDREKLSKTYQEKRENLNKAELELKRIQTYLTRIGDMLQKRKEKLKYFRKNTELCIILTFTKILSENGYKGSLSFDPLKRTLSLKAASGPDKKALKSLHSLSGGERNYVTISFLLALWDRTTIPFRILDEYDVFMDANNRQLSVDLLYRKAEEMAQTQFIFLSPQELASLPKSDYINVIKMADPKRKSEDNENLPRKKLRQR